MANIKIQISKLKNQSSTPQTVSGSIDKILVPVVCLRCLRSFQVAMKQLRHVDVTMTLTSSGVFICGLPGGGLPFLLPGCRKRVCRRYIVRSLHPKQQHMHLLLEVKMRYFCNFDDSMDGD